MRPPYKIFFAAFFPLALTFAFNALFLRLDERPPADQILLTLLPAAALTYAVFWLRRNGRNFRLPRADLSSARTFFKENAPGVLLAALFFAAYLWLGLGLNFSNNDTTDNFLDADNFPWMKRIADPLGYRYDMRGPHPFAYFIFRPFGLLLNFFTRSPRLSALSLNAFAGALCVLFAWMILKRQFGDSVYAALFASLLGLSAAHLFLGAVIETYIFSAAVMLFFVLLLQANGSTFALAVTSLLTFGITLTNFAQNFIAFSLRSLDGAKNFKEALKEIARFVGSVSAFGILLTALHAAVYPTSKIFFLPSDAQAEGTFAYSILAEPSWRAVGRVILLLRATLLYAVIAPKPYVFYKEVGGDFPRFNFFKIEPGTYSFSAYDGLGNVLVFVWAFMLLAAGISFLVRLFRARRADLSLTFALCVLFNFLLHVNYGYEPFLYSPDWAYALVLFVAFALAPLARNWILRGGLLAFLALLTLNQIQFFQFIFATIRPYLIIK